MAADDRLIEIMADLLAEARDIKADLRQFQAQTDKRLVRLEEQQMKTNAALGELRLSVMNLADRIEQLFQLERRVKRLEERLFPDDEHQQAA